MVSISGFTFGAAHRLVLYVFLCGSVLSAISVRAALPAISANMKHAAAVGVDGVVRTWGSDLYGELGLGRAFVASSPAPVSGLGGVQAVSAGYLHTLALRNDGSVWGWGFNPHGALGDGTTTSRSTPAQALNISDVAAVATGQNSSAILKRDGTVWTLGMSGPLQLTGMAGATSISLGYSATLALRNDGTVWAWGLNYFGQLGDGSTVERFTPGPVTGLAGVTAISAGGSYSLALRGDGTVWGWGGNSEGSLGDGSTSDRFTPVRVSGLTGVVAIAAGKGSGLTRSPEHSIALKGDGTVWAWGSNHSGQLGNGTTQSSLVPTRVAALTGVSAISAGGSHTLALKSDGTVWAWGSNAYAQLGDGTSTNRSVPVRVSGLSGVVAISAGGNHSVAIRADGSVIAWGYNNVGQLGNSANVNRTAPSRLNAVANVVAVAAGDYHTLALRSDGTVWTWGSNWGGQLGDGAFLTERSTPAPVPGLTSVVAIAASYNRSVAVGRDGSVWTWGYNNFGQLGNGSYSGSDVPVRLSGLANIIAVSAGFFHSLAVKNDGTVWSWGNNMSGELGDGTNIPRLTPVMVGGLTGVIAVSAGSAHSVAVKADGTVWQWGAGSQSIPSRVEVLGDIVSVAAGHDHTVAIRRDGSVLQWGLGGNPARVDGLTDVVGISAGDSFSLALRQDGTVLGWGDNNLGQLGDGTLATRVAPVVVLREGGGGSIEAGDWFLDLNPAINQPIPVDKIPRFLVVTQGVPTSDVTSFVKFRTQDVGQPIYVYAYAPSSIVKRTAGSKDGQNGCVLSQLSDSGSLQSVTASNVRSYTNGVQSSQAQAVSILSNVSTVNVAGSTFCVSTGGASQSLDPASSQCVVTVPGNQQCLPPPSSGDSTAGDLPGALSGLWWNPAEAGWGVTFTQRRNIIFAAWYTYDDAGEPKWYVASSCSMPPGVTGTIGTCNGALYEVAGSRYFGAPFDPSAISTANVGALQVAFQGADAASMSYTVRGRTRTVTIVRQQFQGGSTRPEVDYTDLWWNPGESGWGMAITQQYDVMFLAWFVYDDAGRAVWYVASSCAVSGNSCAGTLYRTLGPAFGGAFDPSKVQVISVGTVSLGFSDANNGTLSYTVNGQGSSKAIRRQLF